MRQYTQGVPHKIFDTVRQNGNSPLKLYGTVIQNSKSPHKAFDNVRQNCDPPANFSKFSVLWKTFHFKMVFLHS